jgi:hypothetical protein
MVGAICLRTADGLVHLSSWAEASGTVLLHATLRANDWRSTAVTQVIKLLDAVAIPASTCPFAKTLLLRSTDAMSRIHGSPHPPNSRYVDNVCRCLLPGCDQAAPLSRMAESPSLLAESD